MTHVQVRMKETGEVRRVPDYVAEHLISRQKATRHTTRDQDRDLVEFVKTRGYAETAAVGLVETNRDAIRADFEDFKAGKIDADGNTIETAMEAPAAEPTTETAVTPAQNPPARRPSRRRQS
jgi:hypothetical protein